MLTVKIRWRVRGFSCEPDQPTTCKCLYHISYRRWGCMCKTSFKPPSVLLLTVQRPDGSDVVSVACFGVRASMMFYLMFVYYTFSSVWVAEWSPFGKELPAWLAIRSHCLLSICNIIYFPFWFWGQDLAFDCPSSCSLLFYYFYAIND